MAIVCRNGHRRTLNPAILGDRDVTSPPNTSCSAPGDTHPRAADHPHARQRQRGHRRQRRWLARRHRTARRPGAARQGAARPQGGAGRSAAGRGGAALRRAHRPCAGRHRRRQLGARAPAADARCARPGEPAHGHREARAAAAAGGLHLRGLPQRRRLGRHAQHPGHHPDRAVRGRRHRLRGAAHQGRAAAALSERGRRGGARTRLRLRRGHRRARRGDSHPHAAPHQPEPQLRRRGDGGEPGLREAAARAAAAAGQHPHCRSARRSAATWT